MASPALLAAAGEVGGDFFKERTSDTLPCQAKPNHLFCFDWAKENIDRFGTPTVQHLELVVISVLIGFAIAFALALLRPPHAAGSSRRCSPPPASSTRSPASPSSSCCCRSPGSAGTRRSSSLAAYTLQIIYRNTMLGLDNVPTSVKDAARGMGYTDRQILWQVELPLAMPEIIAGLRVAIVSTIAIATLAVFISAGGLGTQMYGGGNLTFPTSVFIAVAIVLLMAIVFDIVLLVAQRLPHSLAKGASDMTPPCFRSPPSAARSNSSSAPQNSNVTGGKKVGGFEQALELPSSNSR